jgi:hypothetical protein
VVGEVKSEAEFFAPRSIESECFTGEEKAHLYLDTSRQEKLLLSP